MEPQNNVWPQAYILIFVFETAGWMKFEINLKETLDHVNVPIEMYGGKKQRNT